MTSRSFMPLAFVFLFLPGCIPLHKTVPPNSPLVDRPWLNKPAVKESLTLPAMKLAARPDTNVIRFPLPPMPTKAVFGAYVEPTQIKGLTLRFEGKTNLLGTNWMLLTNYPYPLAGGLLYYTNAFTNFPALFVREGFSFPP